MRHRSIRSWVLFSAVVALACGGCAADGERSAASTITVDDSAGADVATESSALTTATSTEAPTTTPSAPVVAPPAPSEPSLDPLPPTTRPPDAAGTCEVLRTDGYETRKTVLDDYAAESGDVAFVEVRTQCAADLARVEAARAIEARREALFALETPVELSDFSCFDGGFRANATNRSDDAVGVHLTLRFVWNLSRRLVVTGDDAFVLWRIAPGETVPLSGTYAYEPAPQVDCRLDGVVFLADDSPADAGLERAVDPTLTGDDPSTWLPALVAAEHPAIGSGDPDAATVVEDIRSGSYAGIVAGTTEQRPVVAPDVSVRICADGIRRPTPDLIQIMFSMEAEPTPSTPERDGVTRLSRIVSGIFRRGSDGQWRWLGAARELQSAAVTARCAPASAAD